MIVSKTPYRVSLFGGGLDIPAWYTKHGGAVIGFALDRYCYVSIRPLPPFFEHKSRIVYSKIETVQNTSEIEHPAVRAVLSHTMTDYGVEIHHDGDLPARSGLGSSSAFTVGLLNAIHASKGRRCHKETLAKEAIWIEQKLIGEAVGSQDQIWASYGGFNRIDFHQEDGFTVTPLIMGREKLDVLLGNLVLVFTGFSRLASEVEKKKIENLQAKEKLLFELMAVVEEAENIFSSSRCYLDELGSLLDAGWKIKRELAAGVSNPVLDEIYEAGKAAGALGGKLLGAGAGGFMLFYIHPSRHQALRERLKGLIMLPAGIDHSGSRIIVYDP